MGALEDQRDRKWMYILVLEVTLYSLSCKYCMYANSEISDHDGTATSLYSISATLFQSWADWFLHGRTGRGCKHMMATCCLVVRTSGCYMVPGCFLETGNICSSPVDFCLPQLTSLLCAVPFCVVIWTWKSWRQCINSKRVLMAYCIIEIREKKKLAVSVCTLSRLIHHSKNFPWSLCLIRACQLHITCVHAVLELPHFHAMQAQFVLDL
jgi:hypothetical protein